MGDKNRVYLVNDDHSLTDVTDIYHTVKFYNHMKLAAIDNLKKERNRAEARRDYWKTNCSTSEMRIERVIKGASLRIKSLIKKRVELDKQVASLVKANDTHMRVRTELSNEVIELEGVVAERDQDLAVLNKRLKEFRNAIKNLVQRNNILHKALSRSNGIITGIKHFLDQDK